MTDREYIIESYKWAIGRGLVKNKKTFAAATRVNYSALSTVMNGKGRNTGKHMSNLVRLWREGIERSAQDPYSSSPNYDTMRWSEYRMIVAKEALCSLLQGAGAVPAEEVCEQAVKYADALIKKLRK